jgi:hypothetical protein
VALVEARWKVKEVDLVFACFHGFPWWSVRTLSELKPGKKYLVFTYSYRKTTSVLTENSMDFKTNKTACAANKHQAIKRTMTDLANNPDSSKLTSVTLGLQHEITVEM